MDYELPGRFGAVAGMGAGCANGLEAGSGLGHITRELTSESFTGGFPFDPYGAYAAL